MKLIPYSIHSGKENMQIDSDLLEAAVKNKSDEAVFRLYGWSPMCISLGRNQKSDIFSDSDIDCVRRLTGGRALLHDDEVTYSFISPVANIPDGESVIESYKYISGILIDFFKTLGIDLNYGENKKIDAKYEYCMLLSTGADVCYQNKKIIGSAQCRKNGYILQHGSILFGYDKKLLESLFHEKISGITTVTEIMPNITKEFFISEFEKFITNLPNKRTLV